MGNWRDGGVDIGDLFVLNGEFEHRLGHGWARGRLKQGDVLVAIRHSGDCFHDYLLLDPSKIVSGGKTMLRLVPVATPFGSYTLGDPIGTLPQRQLGLALAGEEFMIDIPDAMPEPASDPRIEALPRHVRMEALSPVADFGNSEGGERPHDWRSHIGESVAATWTLLPHDVRLAIAADAHEKAGQEEYA